jgi:hypothetical protein
MFRRTDTRPTRPTKRSNDLSVQEHAMRKVLRGYARDKNGNLTLIGAIPVPH